ncbi:hypothetical protein Tco_0123336 [Tanacetum coccineum]
MHNSFEGQVNITSRTSALQSVEGRSKGGDDVGNGIGKSGGVPDGGVLIEMLNKSDRVGVLLYTHSSSSSSSSSASSPEGSSSSSSSSLSAGIINWISSDPHILLRIPHSSSFGSSSGLDQYKRCDEHEGETAAGNGALVRNTSSSGGIKSGMQAWNNWYIERSKVVLKTGT